MAKPIESEISGLHLDADQQKLAAEWIKENWNKACRCGSTDVAIGGLHRVIPFTPGTVNLGGPAFIYLAVSCKNCANTQFFNATIMGLVD